MSGNWSALRICALAGIAVGAGVAQPRARVIVRPVEIQEVLVNPGMGIQTFQRFNGDPLNPGLRWSEVGPTAKPEGTGRPARSKRGRG